MANQYINKIIYGNETLIDLTADTAIEDKVLTGYTFHKANGERVSGTCAFDVDSSDVTASQSEVLSGKTFAKNGNVLFGTMPNIGGQNSIISDLSQLVTIQQGYHDGSGSVGIDPIEIAKIIAGNIKTGVEILGVIGTYTGAELIKATSLTTRPSVERQVVLPQSSGDYDYFTQVTVEPIPYTEVDNAAGGVTVTIAPVAA